MYRYLETNEAFTDLQSETAKINYVEIIHSLDGITLPDIPRKPYFSLTTRCLSKQAFENFVNYLCDKVFLDKETNLLAKEVFTNRTSFTLKGFPYGFTSYDTAFEKLIDIEGAKYYISPSLAVHELTHAILILHGVSIPKKYEEVLSIFNEIIAASESEPVVYDEWVFNKIMNRLRFKVYLVDLSDEAIESRNLSNNLYFECYFRMLNLVYALRLFELYTLYPEQVHQDVNEVLNNKSSIHNLLKKYDISLINEDTVLAFNKLLEKYESVVRKYFSDRKRS